MSDRLIPKEKLKAFTRWQFAGFPSAGGPHDSAAGTPARGGAGQTAGFEEGRRAGFDAGRQAAAAEAQRLKAAADAAEAALQGLAGRVATEVLDLALALAGQLLRTELETRPEAILPLVREAMAVLPHNARHAEITLHPLDAQVVRSHLGEELARGQWRIAEDAGLARGGCRIAAAGGDVDATLQTRWQTLLESLGRKHVENA